jgi:hypothetical protein
MSDNPQHDYIISTLELIRDKQFWDTDPNVTDDQRKRLQEALSDHAFQLMDTYEKERAIDHPGRCVPGLYRFAHNCYNAFVSCQRGQDEGSVR